MTAALDPQRLRRALERAPGSRGLVVAYSGGRDSHVLLHAASRTGLPLAALHVDHGLHPDSGLWAEHCAAVCRELGIPLHLRAAAGGRRIGRGLEAAAREQRYRCFEAFLAEDQTLLLAHHRDDQAETVLQRLIRGAGPAGLAGMPRSRRLGAGWLLRPLLEVPGADIETYARDQGLAWIEDPSNADPHAAERNLLRHEILPRLRRRRPGVDAALARSAELQAETAALLARLADAELGRLESEGTVGVAELAGLDEPLRLLVVRRWLQRAGREPPGRSRLRQGLADLLGAGADREPELTWDQGRLRRHRGRLHQLPARLAPPPEAALAWCPARTLEVPGLGRLWQEPAQGGLDPGLLGRDDLSVDFRRGGETCRLPDRGRRDLRRLLQEMDLPPWERSRLPLLWVAGEIAAVGDRVVCAGFLARPGRPGWRLAWDW